MEKTENKAIENEIANIITGRPQEFRVHRKLYRLYPVTLAKMYMLRRYMDELSLDMDLLKVNPYIEALRLASTKPDVCAGMIAVHATPNTYKDLCDNKAITTRTNVFRKLEDEDLATLLVIVLSAENTDRITAYLGIDDERRRLEQVMELKSGKDSNSLSFFGKSVFGSFIEPLKQMGYTDNEILYERGYSYLRLMLADKPTSIYISDEERKELPSSAGGTMLEADSPETFEKLRDLYGKRGLKFEE